ncbi:hypothetical protein [Skermania piniformis]|uniref:DUF222 domain-containing protein n=1 Tax=Skermania pinensis TaxID=39122 RepID=A0ABX8SEY4_9ACTN|nr:hypothetical protein [Skermania piniformis]QXQ15155.1 hypothetical protein KV203_07380 [Skermania piniformis]
MTALDRLCADTGMNRDVVAALGPLGDDRYAELAAAFERARMQRKQELRAATENGLNAVPRLLRPAVRAVLSA